MPWQYNTILLSLSDPLITRITVSQTYSSQDSSSVVCPSWWAREKKHEQVPHFNSNMPKWKHKHHYPEQHLNNIRYEILHMYSCFHNAQGRWLHGFCLQLSHFFTQSMKLLAHCFIFVLPFKLNNKKTHIHFRLNTVLLKLHHVAAISKKKQSPVRELWIRMAFPLRALIRFSTPCPSTHPWSCS